MALQFLLTSAVLASLQLEVAPVGWNEIKYLYQRDPTYQGVMLTGSADLTFWKTGAEYLRTLYEGGTDVAGKTIPAGGVDALAVLQVYENDPNEFRTAEILRQRIDFTTYRSSENGVQVKLKELGFATNLLARADTAVDLLGRTSLGGNYLPPFTPATIKLHSQMLRLKYAASQSVASDLSVGNMYNGGADPSHEQLLYFGFDTAGTNDLGLEPVGGGFVAGDASTVVPIYVAKESGRTTIELLLAARIVATNNGTGPGFETVEGDWSFRINDGARVQLIPDFYQGDLDGDYIATETTGVKTFTVDLHAGDRIYLYGRYFVHDIGGINPGGIRYRSTITATLQAGSYLNITIESTTPETPARGLLVHEALRHLTEAIADEPGGFYSEYYGRTDCYPRYALDGPGSLRLLTNGFGLRGFPLPTDDVPVNTDGTDPRKPLMASFQDVYTSLNAIDCLGAGMEQRNGKPTLRIEPRQYFFQPVEVLRLGAVQGLAKSPYTSLYFNEAHVGYQHWQSGAAVGLDEFNGQRTYALPLTSLKATYSILSSINAAGYLIEQARRQPFATGTNAEGQADDELFVITLRRDAGTGALVTKKAEGYRSVSGILDGNTAYNLDLAPGRMLRRHGFWLRAGLVPQTAAGKKLLRGAVEGNDKLVSQRATESQAIDEHADIPLTDLDKPLFIAEAYEFTVKLRRNQLRALDKNPHGLISFLDGSGTRKSGYLLKLECSPESGQASVTLLRAAV